MKESEKVKKWFDSELSMRPEESLDSVECEEVKEICLNAIEEREQYRAIGTVEELKTMRENGAFSAFEMAQLIAKMNKLKEYEAGDDSV